MDCRKLFVTAALGLGMLAGNVSAGSPLATLFPKKEPKHPKAATYVAWAVFQERQAANPGLNASQQQNIFDSARRHYQRALEIDPAHLPAYTGLARVYMEMNHYDKAEETYRKAMQKFPKSADLWFLLGMCHCREKQWEAAIASFQKARTLEPESRTVTQTLGFCQARAGRIQESLETLSKVMPAAEANYTVARMLHHMKRDDLCRTYLTGALSLKSDLAGARDLQAALEQSNRPQLDIQFDEKR